MKTSKFQKYLGGTTVCTMRLAIDTKGCVQLTSNDTYSADICFSSVNTAEEVIVTGVDYFRLLEMSHKVFCPAKLEKLMKAWPGVSYLVMKSTPRATVEITLMSIHYK